MPRNSNQLCKYFFEKNPELFSQCSQPCSGKCYRVMVFLSQVRSLRGQYVPPVDQCSIATIVTHLQFVDFPLQLADFFVPRSE